MCLIHVLAVLKATGIVAHRCIFAERGALKDGHPIVARAALRGYDAHFNDTRCDPTRHVAWEDVEIAKCLAKTLGVEPEDTRDSSNRERFHPFDPGYMLMSSGRLQDWYYNYSKEWGVLPGVLCCAPDSVSFHYIRPAMARHLHKLLYDCPP